MPTRKLTPPPWARPFNKRPDFGRDLQLMDQRLRGFKGSRFGAASRGRKLTPAEVADIEAQMRAEGKL